MVIGIPDVKVVAKATLCCLPYSNIMFFLYKALHTVCICGEDKNRIEFFLHTRF